MNPINVIFLWHFHQPYYKDNFTGEMLMPWTRLHATKDYYFMGAVLKNHPSIHATFNYSPSLIKQLDDYTADYTGLLKNEKFLSISDKNISQLTEYDRLFIIEKFFPACSSSNHFIEKSPHFTQLYYRLKTAGVTEGYAEKLNLFDSQDYLDIIVLFNLLWIDPLSINSDEFLAALKTKDKKFTEAEKDRLIKEKIPNILNDIFPLITGLANSGQVELSASPYYHPILPLLCDTGIADFHDGIKPPKSFRHPEDADHQIKSALNYFEEKFNYRISGMWPSEGSISEAALRLFIENNVNWIASDEDILSNSIGVNLADLNNRKLLYRPYVIKRDSGCLYIFFRDKVISDSIGFRYQNYEPKAAADDLINNLKNIAVSMQDYNKNCLSIVPIILDGENAWEYYKNNGYDFFNYLYDGLSKNTETIKTVTVSEYLKKAEKALSITNETAADGGKTAGKTFEFSDIKWNSPQDFDSSKIYNIPTIYPGSWINHDFRIWIGDKEDNKSWDLLSETRDYLLQKNTPADGAGFKEAWEQIYIAEGSDYNWWYGEDRTSGIDDEYDSLYRTHLINVYKFLNDNPPDDYYIPILEKRRAVKPDLDIVSFINPEIDGFIGGYFEWLGSAVYFPSIIAGKAMANTDRFIKKLLYGFSETMLFMRLDFLKKEAAELIDKIILIKFINSANVDVKIEFYIDNKSNLLVYTSFINFKETQKPELKAAFKDVLELGIPISVFKLNPLDPINFYLILTYKNNLLAEIERFPANGYFETVIPDKDFELMNWLV